ncbi:MAG: hypothetical protein P4N59_18745 [Negativicutes bacterium]|nr:hypothetical protein [Negativicutes bacterium]
MKKIILVCLGIMLLGCVAQASPLMDFSAGKGSVDLTYRNSENSSTGDYSGVSPRKYNLDASLTLGLGNNFAFEYRNFNSEASPNPFIYGGSSVSKISTSEFNILYKLDKSVAVFSGLVTAKGQDVFSSYPTISYTTNSKKLWQLGLIGSTAIADKTTLWGSVAAGSSSLLVWEIGLSYEFCPNVELNVNYRSVKSDNFSGTNGGGTHFTIDEAKAKGAGVGITYKF